MSLKNQVYIIQPSSWFLYMDKRARGTRWLYFSKLATVKITHTIYQFCRFAFMSVTKLGFPNLLCNLRIRTIRLYIIIQAKKIITEADEANPIAGVCSWTFCSFMSSFRCASLCCSKDTSSFSCSFISLISTFFSHNWHLLIHKRYD